MLRKMRGDCARFLFGGCFLVFLICFGSGGMAGAETIVESGTISEDTTWTAEGSPYMLNSDLTIVPGKILTLEAGTQILVKPDTASSSYNVDIHVEGTLLSQGTESNGVLITRNGDGGEWRRIYVKPGGSLDMSYTEISYADYSVYSSGREAAPNVFRLDNCNIHHISDQGVHLTGYHKDIALTNNAVSSNDSEGVYISGAYNPDVFTAITIENNHFANNGDDGLKVGRLKRPKLLARFLAPGFGNRHSEAL